MSSIAPDPSVHVQVGAPMASDGSIVRVTMSPSLAFPLPSTAMVTADAVGCVLSIVTDDESDVLVIADAMALPAKSE